ncbi:MAG: nitrate ABC transporter ATP-binding protein, partial [Chloroflexi bacterium]|nr:nitrate ABC transporter ATP-binding protein [Chloroflexota bacterium]
RAADKHQLRLDVFQTALELEFPPEETESLLDTAVNWGRYAEIVAYDDSDETIYLETDEKN